MFKNAGMHIMENISVVDLDPTLPEESHGHGC